MSETEIVCETVMSKRGRTKLLVRGYFVVKNRSRESQFYWKCNMKRSKNCPGRAITTLADGRHYLKKFVDHNHAPDLPEESNINPESGHITVQTIVAQMKNKWNNLMTFYRREMTKVMFIESTLGRSYFGHPDTVPQMPTFGHFQQMLLLENSRNKRDSNCNNDHLPQVDSQNSEANINWLQLFTQETRYDPDGTVLLASCSENVDGGMNGTESVQVLSPEPSSSLRTSKVKEEYEEDEDDDEGLSEDEHVMSSNVVERSSSSQIPDSLSSFVCFVESMLRDMPMQKRKKAMLSISQVLFNDDES